MSINQSHTTYHPHQFGKKAEDAVCDYLQAQGLKLEARNYSSRMGEIDLIMKDGSYLVFIEVRARVNQDFLTSLESINRTKQLKIIKTATFYLQEKQQLDKMYCRFDVVAVKQEAEQLKLHWIKNAFET